MKKRMQHKWARRAISCLFLALFSLLVGGIPAHADSYTPEGWGGYLGAARNIALGLKAVFRSHFKVFFFF